MILTVIGVQKANKGDNPKFKGKGQDKGKPKGNVGKSKPKK